jgi:hypothetical protein
MFRRILRVLLTILAVAVLLPFSARAHAQNIEILVSREGFDHMADYTVDVEAGHQVTITFNYGDDDLDNDNPHELQILGAGVNLPTVTVSRENPRAEITFTATQTGTLTILCIVPCIGMEKLVGGTIHVIKPKETGLATSMSLDLSPSNNESALARVMLADSRGSPVSGEPVTFTLHTSVGGELILGTPLTAEDGSAELIIPATAGQTLRVSASFEGGNGFASSQYQAEIKMPGEALTNPVGVLSSPTPPPVLAMILLVVLGGIWLTYGSVVFQVFRIRNEGGSK